jgi:hypothetical protein
MPEIWTEFLFTITLEVEVSNLGHRQPELFHGCSISTPEGDQSSFLRVAGDIRFWATSESAVMEPG